MQSLLVQRLTHFLLQCKFLMPRFQLSVKGGYTHITQSHKTGHNINKFIKARLQQSHWQKLHYIMSLNFPSPYISEQRYFDIPDISVCCSSVGSGAGRLMPPTIC